LTRIQRQISLLPGEFVDFWLQQTLFFLNFGR